MHSAHRRRFEPMSSSPPPSSSPPRTPSHVHTRADIHSSPDMAYRGVGQRWGRYPVAAAKEQPKYPAPRVHRYTSSYAPDPFYSRSYGYGYPYPPRSDFDASEYAYADDGHHDHDVPDLDSEPASATDSVPPHSQSSGVFSDFSEEEERDDVDRPKVNDHDDDDIDRDEDGDEQLSFGYGGSRATFFRTSAERGQWKTNPMPYKPNPIPKPKPTLALAPAPISKLITRKSEPTPSRAATPKFNRPISEPVFSAPQLPDNESENQDHSKRATAQNIRTSAEPPPSSVQNIRKSTEPSAFVPDSTDAQIISPSDEDAVTGLPALSEDRGSSVDLDIDMDVNDDDQALCTPSSPLPPSSPPPPLSSPAPMSPPSSPSLYMRMPNMNTHMLAHKSSSKPPMSRSVSPTVLNHEEDETSLRGSSPLSELPDEDDEEIPEVETAVGVEVVDADVEMDTSPQTEKKEQKPTSTKVYPLAISALLCAPVDAISLAVSSTVLIVPPTSTTASTTPPSAEWTALAVVPEPAPPPSLSSLSSQKMEAEAPKPKVTSAIDDVAGLPAESSNPNVIPESSGSLGLVVELVDEKKKGKKEERKTETETEGKAEQEKTTVVMEAKTKITVDEALRDKKNVKTAEKRKGEQQEVREKKKKQKVAATGDENDHAAEASSSKSASKAISSSSDAPKPKTKKRPVVEVEDAEGGDVSSRQQSPAPRPKKRKRSETPALASTSASTSKSAKRASASSRQKKDRIAASFSDSDEEEPAPANAPSAPAAIATADNDAATAALHMQITGLLIETMATSRASSLAVSTLYKMLMRAQPALRAERTQKEWCRLFDRVLRGGEAAAAGSGVFGKVESSGKDDADRPLEAQWFYVPEMDQDQERAAVIRAMMPRPAKRSETKKYKQYYWRPLDKISRWDPEDEL